MTNLKRIGYGQVELNNVAFRRDGRIEAQLPLDSTVFNENNPAQNGMILAADKSAGKVTFDGSLYALNYTTEHMYDERKNALSDFCLVPGTVYPRMGFLAKGDTFTTNLVATADGTLDAVTAGSKGYILATGNNGVIQIGTTEEEKAVEFDVAAVTTMPDGQKAVKLQVIAV